MKTILPLTLLFISTSLAAQHPESMLGYLEECLSYIDAGGENNLDQAGVQNYFTTGFNKLLFDKTYEQTAEYGWDTVVYHYLNALWFLNKPNVGQARQECYKAGLSYAQTSAANRNVLARFGFTLHRLNHLREYIDFGEHINNKSLGFDGGKEVKGYTGYSDASTGGVPAFLWPPPQASTDCVLPQEMLSGVTTLGAADAKLTYALATCGYAEKSYFTVPGGFALVTRMEQFNDDGTCKPDNDRWNVSLKPSSFDLSDYFRALFWGRKGKYRIIVFIVTDQVFTEAETGASPATARQWLRTGAKYLPPSIAGQPFSVGHRCTALVYEFELKETLTEPRFISPATKPGLEHIQKSGIWKNIK